MTRRILLSASILALVASTGCSSSSSSNPGGAVDSGTTTETDSSMTMEDSGTGTDTGTIGTTDSSTGTEDTGTTPGDGSVTLTCPPAKDAGTYAPVTYVPATKGTNQCAAADISAFVTACASATSTGAGCNAWLATNVAGQASDGGGAGNTCGNCIFNPNNAGAIWLDPDNYFGPNYAGCIQLTDATNGATCAAAFNNINGCDGQSCDQCQKDGANAAADTQACDNAVNGGACSSLYTTFTGACASDLNIHDAGAAAAACFSGSGATAQATDMTYVANLICGNGQ